MKFTKQTGQVALVFFTLYFVYGLFYTPFTQYLVSLAVGGIVYGISDSYELATIALLATNYVFPLFVRNRNEGFVGEESEPVPKKESRENATDVLPSESLQGVGSQMSEGFADAEEVDMSLSETKKTSESAEVSVGKSKPASAKGEAPSVDPKDLDKMAAMMKQMMATMNKGEDALAPSKATKISEDNIPSNKPQDLEKESFEDKSGLFKLGQIPKDEKGGHHIDAGTTVMNAISALKPDQIKAMTMDTKQLIETQKSLMGMLQTFQPMVSEGKQMMETFQEMFSPAMGSLNAASAAVGKK